MEADAAQIRLGLRILLHNSQINDLRGLESAERLRSLDLSQNDGSDLSPLSGLTTLRDLSLSENEISDLTPLSSLTLDRFAS